MPDFSDPRVILRVVVLALSAISLVLLIAGIAVDEYVSISSSRGKVTLGCQKQGVTLEGGIGYGIREDIGTSFRAPYSCMSTLAFFLIVLLSLLCLLQAAAIGLNALALTEQQGGITGKVALVPSFVLTSMLIMVLLLVHTNFSSSNIFTQSAIFSVYASANYDGSTCEKAMESASDLQRTMEKNGSWKRVVEGMQMFGWSTSYALLCTAFAFSILNLVLLLIIMRLPEKDAAGTEPSQAYVPPYQPYYGGFAPQQYPPPYAPYAGGFPPQSLPPPYTPMGSAPPQQNQLIPATGDAPPPQSPLPN